MNTSGVPGQLVRTEQKLGFDSRLVTLYRDRRNYYQDICLDLPFIDFKGTRLLKRFISDPDKLSVKNVRKTHVELPPVWRPYSVLEDLFVRLRDALWRPQIQAAIRAFGLDNFDIYELDGGLDLYRNTDFTLRMKHIGKKIICLYTGSDLRTRGVIPAIDAIADLNLTVEFDHLQYHPSIHHVFFPFEPPDLKPQKNKKGKLRIGHAPTNWSAKGSHVIVPILRELESEFPVECVLIQNLTHEKALYLKSTCDIFVDQIGDLGYGINALEALAMAIPTCSCLAPGFAELYPDHPFVVIQADNLKESLIRLILDTDMRKELGQKGRDWTLDRHNAVKIVQHIHHLMGLKH